MISLWAILSIADFYGWLSIIGTLIGFIYVYRYRHIISRNYLKSIEKDIYKQTGIKGDVLFAKPLVKPSYSRSTPIANLNNF
jgi:hypothetical protein